MPGAFSGYIQIGAEALQFEVDHGLVIVPAPIGDGQFAHRLRFVVPRSHAEELFVGMGALLVYELRRRGLLDAVVKRAKELEQIQGSITITHFPDPA